MIKKKYYGLSYKGKTFLFLIYSFSKIKKKTCLPYYIIKKDNKLYKKCPLNKKTLHFSTLIVNNNMSCIQHPPPTGSGMFQSDGGRLESHLGEGRKEKTGTYSSITKF